MRLKLKTTLSHQDAVSSLQEFTAGGVDKDPILLVQRSSRRQTGLSPGTSIPALPERDTHQHFTFTLMLWSEVPKMQSHWSVCLSWHSYGIPLKNVTSGKQSILLGLRCSGEVESRRHSSLNVQERFGVQTGFWSWFKVSSRGHTTHKHPSTAVQLTVNKLL